MERISFKGPEKLKCGYAKRTTNENENQVQNIDVKEEERIIKLEQSRVQGKTSD